MKAAQLFAPSKFRFIDAEEPKLIDGESKIKILSTSVCGSDIHSQFRGDFKEEEYPRPPGMPCHEIVGKIIESKNSLLKEGQRVIVIPGRNNYGGLTEYIKQVPELIIPIPDWGSAEEWVMCQHTGTVLFSAKKWGNPAGKTIAILGQGGIGLSFTMIAEKQGAENIIGIDLLDYRLKKALELGATHTINPSNENLYENINEITKGAGVDIVVDATGDPSAFETSIKLIKRYGLIISFSLTGSESKRSSFVHTDFMRKAAKIIPTQMSRTSEPTKEIREIVKLKERGWIDPGKLKSHNFDFIDVQKAYDTYADYKNNVIKLAINISND